MYLIWERSINSWKEVILCMAKKIIFDEYCYAEKILKDGFTRYINRTELSYLAKYYKLQGFSIPKIENKLIEFCISFNPYFNSIVNKDIIKYAISTCKNYKMKQIIPVVITKNEIDVLKTVSRKYAKILFMALVIAKFDKFNMIEVNQTNRPVPLGYYANYTFEEILKKAHVWIKKSEINNLKYELDGKLNLLSSTLEKENAWRVNFADDKSDPVILIEDFSDVMSYLPCFCCVCGKVIEKTSNRRKMCDDCRKEKERNRARGNFV
jgi:hypothetical protein